MLEIFKTQSDYLAFLIGLGFSFSLLICLSLSRFQRSQTVYLALALFSLSQWISQWVVLVTPAWNSPVAQKFIADIFVILGLSSLGACGFAGTLSVVGRGIAVGILTLILSVAWLIDLLNNFHVFGPIVFFAGLGCSFLTGGTLLRLAHEKHSMVLGLAAMALTGYGVTMPLSLPENYFALIPAVHELDRFLSVLMPLPAFQVLFSSLITFSMWFYYQDEVWRQPAKENFAGDKPFMYSTYFILAICFIMAIGGVSTGLFGRNLEREMRQELASRARMLAAALPPEAVRKLTAREADIGTPYYEELKRIIMAIHGASKDCRFVYLMAFKDKNAIFLVDSEPVTSPDYSPPGQIYEEATASLKSMALEPRAFVEGPEVDRWGTWVTAFEVIKDPDSGKFLALLGLDIDASDWQRKIALHKLLPINITLLMIILLTGFYLSQQKLLASAQQMAESEEALRTRQAKLDGIFRAAPVGIGLLVNRVFKEVNGQVCSMTGYPRKALLEKSSRLLYRTQEDYDFVGREKYEQIAEHGKGTVETHWVRQDGTVIDVMLSSAPLFEGTQPQEILFTAMDITERKKLEAVRFTIDKMETLGIMAGGIAHDFNNVLMSILGNISLVGLAATSAEVEERLGDAEQGCRQAMLLAKQLLTFAKGGAPVKKPDELRLIIQEAAKLALSGSKSKTIFSFPEDLYTVDVDRGQMHQVITNLLINADQAMPLGGQIHIRAQNFTTTRKPTPTLLPGKYVLVTIADQGMGIAPDQLDKIFDPYYSTKQKGSGLGLATVYSIVKQHGGLITCDSKLGHGAVFSLYLPASKNSGKLEQLGGKRLFTGCGRILVLEDDATVTAVMQKMLATLGYKPVFAPEGQEALDLFARARRSREPFDLVILDLTIPGGMGGLETFKGMLAQDPRTKAIVSSGYADDPVLANFQNFGFRGVIIKPYRITELSEVLNRVIN